MESKTVVYVATMTDFYETLWTGAYSSMEKAKQAVENALEDVDVISERVIADGEDWYCAQYVFELKDTCELSIEPLFVDAPFEM